VGDTLAAAVAREVREESGFEVVPRKVVGVFDANSDRPPLAIYHAYKIVVLCEIVGGKARPSDETSEIAFFGPGELPPLSVWRTGERHIAEVFAHVADPGRPTFFE
jgi:ADP-ribose pyrophosphatase YjhB (NUDIX family)